MLEHGKSLQNIQDELTDVANGKSGAHLAAAFDELRAANERLQSELTTARLLLEEHAGKQNSVANRETAPNAPREAKTDPVTLLLNRPTFESELQQFIDRPQPGESKGTLLVLSAEVVANGDKNAGTLGDAPLQQLVRAIRSTLLGSDSVTARSASQEFSIIVPAGKGTQVKQIVRDLLGAIESTRFKDTEGEIAVCISVGLMDISPRVTREEHMQRTAQAVKAARAAGGNCCYQHNGRECVPFELDRRRRGAADSAPTTGVSAAPPAAPAAPVSTAAAVPIPPPQPAPAPAVPWTGKEQRAHRRQKCSSTYFIAPYDDGKFPSPGMFFSARFADISPGGCAIMLPNEPTQTSFIVALSKPDGVIHLSAKVVRVKKTDEITPSGQPLYMVGCRFTGRVQATPSPQPQPALAAAGSARSR